MFWQWIIQVLKYMLLYFLGTQKHRIADLWPPFERLHATDPSSCPRVCWNDNDGPGTVQKVGRKLTQQCKEWENMCSYVFLVIYHHFQFTAYSCCDSCPLRVNDSSNFLEGWKYKQLIHHAHISSHTNASPDFLLPNRDKYNTPPVVFVCIVCICFLLERVWS